MSNDCDMCGSDMELCQCLVYELAKRVDFLSDELDKLTEVVNKIHDYIMEAEDVGKV